MSMGDGAHINNVFNVGSMDDVGKRITFLTELYELWQQGIDILDRFDKNKASYESERQKLVNARDMLWFHMTKDYQDREDRASIDGLPLHGDDIKDIT